MIGFRPELWRSLVPASMPPDLTGFIDGSENPTLLDAPMAALIPEGQPGAGGSVLLLQKWKHKVADWEALPVDRQEQIMGRTKPDHRARKQAGGFTYCPHGSG